MKLRVFHALVVASAFVGVPSSVSASLITITYEITLNTRCVFQDGADPAPTCESANEQLQVQLTFDDGITDVFTNSSPTGANAITVLGDPSLTGLTSLENPNSTIDSSLVSTAGINQEILNLETSQLARAVRDESSSEVLLDDGTTRIQRGWLSTFDVFTGLDTPGSPDLIVSAPTSNDVIAWLGGSLGQPILFSFRTLSFTFSCDLDAVGQCDQTTQLLDFVEGSQELHGTARVVSVVTPEPATLSLFGTAVIALAFRWRRCSMRRC